MRTRDDEDGHIAPSKFSPSLKLLSAIATSSINPAAAALAAVITKP